VVETKLSERAGPRNPPLSSRGTLQVIRVLAIADTSSTEFLRRETADWG